MTRPDDETLELMRRAVEALPYLPFKVFRLHRFKELDYPVIAEKLGISVREVERNLARAIYLIDRHMQRAEKAERRRR
jgi:DNA-directed RNA polymerase specialized sigma24 family protein